MKLNKPEMMRYSRHFPIIGIDGQEKLKHAKVLCVGTGGLGSPALLYLCAAGVGTLGLVDNDQVAVSNLHRQILFTEADIEKPKVLVAQARLLAQNPHIQVNAHPERLVRENAEALIANYDIVLDGSDNFKTRYLLNDVCFFQKKPLVSASIFQYEGQVGIFNAADGPCYRCLYPEPPPPELSPNCDISGVLGVLPGIVGTIQAAEVIKLILKKGTTLAGRLLQIDALNMQFKEYTVKKDPQCPLCQHGKLSASLFTTDVSEKVLPVEIDPELLAAWLQDPDRGVALIDVREPYERAICNIGGELLPFSQFDLSQVHLDPQTPIVVYCKIGGRSQKIARVLKEAGFQKVYSLKGGIINWIERVDPEMNRY